MRDPEYPERAKKYLYKAHELEPDSKLYKDNLKLAIMHSTPFYKYHNKLMRPIRESKCGNFFYLLLLSVVPVLIKFAYRMGNFTKYPTLQIVLIILALLLVLYGLTLFVVEIITSLLIRLKILK